MASDLPRVVVADGDTAVITREIYKPHPCKLPKMREIRKRELDVGTEATCPVCGERWVLSAYAEDVFWIRCSGPRGDGGIPRESA